MGRRLAKWVAVALVLAGAVAVSSPSGVPVAHAGPATIEVAIILKNLVNPYFVNMKNGAEAAGRDLGARVTALAPQKPDNVEEQLRMLENLVQRRVNAIVLVPADSQAIVPGVRKAVAAGIPIFNADTKVAGLEGVISFFGIDNVAVGEAIARYVVDYVNRRLNGKADVVILEGVPGAQTAIDRQTGILRVLREHPGIRILASQTANYNRVQAATVMDDLLTRFAHIDVVIAHNDEMALGALSAIEAAGRAKEMVVVGINAAENAVAAIKEGRLLASYYANEYGMAYQATAAAIRYVREGVRPPKEVLGKVGLVVDRSNVDTFRQLAQQQLGQAGF